jgi:hypothetical protein
MNTLPEPAARALRTFIQAAVGTFLMLVIVPHAAPGYVHTEAPLPKREGRLSSFVGVWLPPIPHRDVVPNVVRIGEGLAV